MKLTEILAFTSLHFLRFSQSFTITSHPNLERVYEERLNAYSVASASIDPLPIVHVDKLKEVCAELSRSNMYRMLSANESLKPPEERYQFNGEVNESYDNRYQCLKVKFANKEKLAPVNLFPCPMHVNSSDFWFIGYGFLEDIKYLFQRPANMAYIKLEALVEPSPRLDVRMSHVETYLEKSFMNIMSRRKPAAEEEDPLCSLNANQSFRLCSAISNVMQIRRTSWKFFINYAEHYSKRRSRQGCLENQRMVLSEVSKSPGKYPIEEMRVNVVPCSINTVADSPSFYLTSNPGEENSVFLLHEHTKSPNSMVDEKRFTVKAHIQDVSALKYAMEIF